MTGAFGCIGAWVCKRLLEAGERTVAFDVADDSWRMRMIVGPERLRDVVMVKAVGEYRVDRIIHLAAWQVPLCRQDPSRGALINVVGTANVFAERREWMAGRGSRHPVNATKDWASRASASIASRACSTAGGSTR